MTSPTSKRLLDIKDAGVYLSISHWTIRELLNRGEIPYCRIGRKILLDLRDLDRFVEGLKEKVI
ncbi:MAG: hypothetical protein A2W23_08635 [Planctomycetes bacterium RBG_16_43_13]|nr:MAG: hypothetical protein A2W23_08635 [Planctomycetes bacterium RBG_16_43_13]